MYRSGGGNLAVADSFGFAVADSSGFAGFASDGAGVIRCRPHCQGNVAGVSFLKRRGKNIFFDA